MRAAYIERLGGAEEIRVGEVRRPEPAAGQVLVRVAATVVNPVDTLVRSGRYATPLPGFPFVVGRDLVGQVAAVGAATTGFSVGDHVWCASLGHDGRQGAAAEYAVVDAARLYPLPDGLDPVPTVAALHPTLTAWLGLQVHAGGVGPGDTVVVQGGAGNVGSAVTEVASASGARVVALARAGDAEWCSARGADAVIDFRSDDLGARISEQVDGRVTTWFDTSGVPAATAAAQVLAPRGHLIVIAGREDQIVLPLWRFYTRSLRLVGFVISTATVGELARAADAVNALLADRKLTPRVAEVRPLEQTADAHRLVEEGIRGRVVLTV